MIFSRIWGRDCFKLVPGPGLIREGNIGLVCKNLTKEVAVASGLVGLHMKGSGNLLLSLGVS